MRKLTKHCHYESTGSKGDWMAGYRIRLVVPIKDLYFESIPVHSKGIGMSHGTLDQMFN